MVAAKLYELHRQAGVGEEYLERWPGDDELFGVLRFAEANADRLRAPEAYRQAALYRVTLAEWLRASADPFQLRALDDARTAGISWDRLALVLGFTTKQGEPSPGSAHNRRSRLYVAIHGTPEDRRQPQVAQLIDRRAADARLTEAQRVRVEDTRYPAMNAAARGLLSHFHSGEIAVDPEDSFWWEELTIAVDDREGASERANLVVYVRSVVRETFEYAHRSSQDPAVTDEAKQALEYAAALVEASGEAG